MFNFVCRPRGRQTRRPEEQYTMITAMVLIFWMLKRLFGVVALSFLLAQLVVIISLFLSLIEEVVDNK